MYLKSLPLLGLALATASQLLAQSTPKAPAKPEKKEIVIEEKSSGKNEKMIIVIDGEKVTINGKPAADYKGKKVIIADNMHFDDDEIRLPRKGRLTYASTDGKKRALLGVVTEKDDKGAKVTDLNESSAAAKAGLKTGDVITGINGKTIAAPDDLVAAIAKQKPADEVTVSYLRNGKSKTTKATLGEKSDDMAMNWNWSGDENRVFEFEAPMAMAMPPMKELNLERSFDFSPKGENGFTFRSSTMKPKYGMNIEDNADGDGVKVNEVDPESNAEKAGLKVGDLITEVEGKNIKGTDALREVLAASKDKISLSVKVLRNGKAETLNLRVPKVIKKADL